MTVMNGKAKAGAKSSSQQQDGRIRWFRRIVTPAVIIQMLVTLGAVAVAYFQFVIPRVQDEAKDQTDTRLEEKGADVNAIVSDVQSLKNEAADLRKTLEELRYQARPPQSVVTGQVQQNNSSRPLFITLFCNATNESKDMEARIGEAQASLSLVASESGPARMSTSVVVPPGWFYRVDFSSVPGIGCNFRSWAL